MYKNTNDINDTEYRRMRKAEDSSYEYHGEEDDEANDLDAADGYRKQRTIILNGSLKRREPMSVSRSWMAILYMS